MTRFFCDRPYKLTKLTILDTPQTAEPVLTPVMAAAISSPALKLFILFETI